VTRAPAWVVVAAACGARAPGPAPTADVPAAAAPADAAPADAPAAALDRTLWDCEFSLAVFWGDHLLRVHRDVAMMVMGSSAIASREDHDLRWTGPDSFEAALRHVEFPQGQRRDFDADEPFERYTFRRDGHSLTITHPRWDEPVTCVEQGYDDDFVQWMDARYAR
jgi:hypothetical protein